MEGLSSVKKISSGWESIRSKREETGCRSWPIVTSLCRMHLKQGRVVMLVTKGKEGGGQAKKKRVDALYSFHG